MPRNFSTASARRKWEASTVPAAELWTRCQAAARMSMQGQNFSTEERLDAASDALERATAAAFGAPAYRGSAADVLAWLERAEDLGRMASAQRYPLAVASFGKLCGYCANYRRGLERLRDRDMQEGIERAARADFTAWTAAPVSETAGSPVGARRAAVDMLRGLGVLGPVVQWGPLWTAAYAAARSATADLESDAIATELELTPDAYRAHLSRAAGRIPAVKAGATRYAVSVALDMPEGGRALKPSRSRTEAHSIGDRADGWRDYVPAAAHAEVATRRTGKGRTSYPLSDWARELCKWTAGSPEHRRASRLAAAAALRRDRAGLTSARDRAALKR